LVGWLVGWLVDWLAGRLVGWLLHLFGLATPPLFPFLRQFQDLDITTRYKRLIIITCPSFGADSTI
jgi:hypothetical protein